MDDQSNDSNGTQPSRDNNTKREDVLSWEDYFMATAFLAAMRSKDPSTQVGACIVNEDKRIVGIGYNGMPNRCSDDKFSWAREATSKLDTKYVYVCHAEMNAIMNKNLADVKNCTMYVALFPCNECAKIIIQSGIREVVYVSDKYKSEETTQAAKKMFAAADIECRQYTPKNPNIMIDFKKIN